MQFIRIKLSLVKFVSLNLHENNRGERKTKQLCNRSRSILSFYFYRLFRKSSLHFVVFFFFYCRYFVFLFRMIFSLNIFFYHVPSFLEHATDIFSFGKRHSKHLFHRKSSNTTDKHQSHSGKFFFVYSNQTTQKDLLFLILTMTSNKSLSISDIPDRDR